MERGKIMGALKGALGCYLRDLGNPVNNRLSLLRPAVQESAVAEKSSEEKLHKEILNLKKPDTAMANYMEG